MPHIPLAIVIPLYNEAQRIGPTCCHIRTFAENTPRPVELILVNDGSTDDTLDVIHRLELDPLTVRVLGDTQNHGKGWAVRQGMLAASAPRRLMCDADLSTPLSELSRLETWLERGCDIAIASRDVPDARLDPPQPLHRRLAAWTFRTFRRRFLVPHLHDTQCGFKLFTGAAAADLFARQTVTGWLFDCEILALADRLGYRIKEVGVHWSNHPDSRVRMWSTACNAPATLWAIRRRLAQLSPPPTP